MRAPGYFWKSPGFASTLLAPLAAVYGRIAAARMRRLGVRAAVPVICVGNPTVGGAGKTPTALALAHMLGAMGERPMLITRGYGGRASGPLLVDPERHAARQVGDEALLLARVFPTVVARDRVRGAAFAVEQGASVVVLDDGFQNPALAKDLSLLVVDGASGIGNGKVFPQGPLRAPLAVQLARAQALVWVGEGAAGERVARQASATNLPVFAAKLVPDPAAADYAGRPVLAFAGIGHPEKFFATLTAAGARLVESRAFPDHHPYSAAEAHALLADADAQGLTLVTTEKDLARMRGDPALADLAGVARALPVQLRFVDETGVRVLVADALARARG